MNEDRIAGTVRNFGGNVQEGIGKASGNATTQARGVMNQAAAAAEELYGQTRDIAREGARTVKEAAIEGHDVLKKFIEDNPHTATLVAMTIGLFIGYTAHRPPARRSWWD
jgi:uncharacterized protein YjbJ (UPF0337 family)